MDSFLGGGSEKTKRRSTTQKRDGGGKWQSNFAPVEESRPLSLHPEGDDTGRVNTSAQSGEEGGEGGGMALYLRLRWLDLKLHL